MGTRFSKISTRKPKRKLQSQTTEDKLVSGHNSINDKHPQTTQQPEITFGGEQQKGAAYAEQDPIDEDELSLNAIEEDARQEFEERPIRPIPIS
mmetsp:Transcript_12533/g.20449  ORF Transcript_12533/g.20449 Transcript_12533/m.20449 type:complete len:94 (-) Transcript_12533:1173-1454(-)|eukprot:CAMPEP_0184652502 /NCGR_PEP_ID=MMETSP0308-20130426/10207_1 /TAXON_ID=38269 /ORGANISM="Gloeochaete witrockiana, Strain SAG 46.84" /LENGTH=93 /DNA_ID=CAMNT_0027087413 /DNA_START=131 /DNA_END=412 /DNA_ORIENTATION=-